jgi:6-pyruvoyltetrahydropterin/6-carboxytetrahydropterin synthase
MYKVSRDVWFSAAHQLRGHRGKCEALHGHNWRVSVTVCAEDLDDLGMVVDFKVLKTHMQTVLERLDHQMLNDVPPFDVDNPSAERIARHVAEEVDRRLTDGRVTVERCDVWENDSSRASYILPPR